jgi:hypothetical protein
VLRTPEIRWCVFNGTNSIQIVMARFRGPSGVRAADSSYGRLGGPLSRAMTVRVSPRHEDVVKIHSPRRRAGHQVARYRIKSGMVGP